MDLLDLAWQDYKHQDRDIIGMIVITIHRRHDDEIGLQVGSNVPPPVVEYAARELVRGWDAGENMFDIIPPTERRKVV